MSVGQSRNNPWLDLVRSIAILLVLVRHGERALHLEHNEPQSFLQTIFMNGWIGVDIFFALSGYLIARHLLWAGIGSDQFHFARYLAMRALRIVPAYFAVLALVAAGVFPFFQVATDGLTYRIVYHLLFLQDYLQSNINVVFWSLGVEEKFYLLAPLLIFVLLYCKSAWLQAAILLIFFLCPILLSVSIYYRIDQTIDYPAFYRIFRSPFHMAVGGLVGGVAIAVAQHGGFVRRSRAIGFPLLFGTTIVLAVWLGTHDFMAEIGPVDALVQPALIAVLAGTMTLGAVQLAGTPMPFTLTFQALSRISYSLYLVHFPLIPMAMASAAGAGRVGFWLCYISVSLSAALLLHFAVERPFLRWKDRLGGSKEAPALSTFDAVRMGAIRERG
jgi:peptidoglycan/LPS O-acetylase OafA/YrhL